MELRICCEQKIELEKYKNLKSINYEIDRYTFDNGELNGNVVVKGIYENNESLENEYIKSVPFTLMFKSSGYEIKELKIDNFKHYDVVNNGIECSFDIFVLYELKISEGSIPNIMSKDEVKEEKIKKEEIKEEKTEKEEIKEEVLETVKEINSDVNNLDIIETIDENSSDVCTDIKDKYDELLNNIFLNREENNVNILDKKDNEKLKLKFNDKIETIRVYFPKAENEIEKICKDEKVTINSVYDNDLNKDFQNKKRIIIKK